MTIRKIGRILFFCARRFEEGWKGDKLSEEVVTYIGR